MAHDSNAFIHYFSRKLIANKFLLQLRLHLAHGIHPISRNTPWPWVRAPKTFEELEMNKLVDFFAD